MSFLFSVTMPGPIGKNQFFRWSFKFSYINFFTAAWRVLKLDILLEEASECAQKGMDDPRKKGLGKSKATTRRNRALRRRVRVKMRQCITIQTIRETGSRCVTTVAKKDILSVTVDSPGVHRVIFKIMCNATTLHRIGASQLVKRKSGRH